MAVPRSGRRSWTPLIDTTRSIRPAQARVMSVQSIRLTRCPPAEWPARRIGPATSALARSRKAAISAVMSAMRASGQSV